MERRPGEGTRGTTSVGACLHTQTDRTPLRSTCRSQRRARLSHLSVRTPARPPPPRCSPARTPWHCSGRRPAGTAAPCTACTRGRGRRSCTGRRRRTSCTAPRRVRSRRCTGCSASRWRRTAGSRCWPPGMRTAAGQAVGRGVGRLASRVCAAAAACRPPAHAALQTGTSPGAADSTLCSRLEAPPRGVLVDGIVGVGVAEGVGVRHALAQVARVGPGHARHRPRAGQAERVPALQGQRGGGARSAARLGATHNPQTQHATPGMPLAPAPAPVGSGGQRRSAHLGAAILRVKAVPRLADEALGVKLVALLAVPLGVKGVVHAGLAGHPRKLDIPAANAGLQVRRDKVLAGGAAGKAAALMAKPPLACMRGWLCMRAVPASKKPFNLHAVVVKRRVMAAVRAW